MFINLMVSAILSLSAIVTSCFSLQNEQNREHSSICLLQLLHITLIAPFHSQNNLLHFPLTEDFIFGMNYSNPSKALIRSKLKYCVCITLSYSLILIKTNFLFNCYIHPIGNITLTVFIITDCLDSTTIHFTRI